MNKMHMTAVEVSDAYGRWWETMNEDEVDDYIKDMLVLGKEISDIDHAVQCWCMA